MLGELPSMNSSLSKSHEVVSKKVHLKVDVKSWVMGCRDQDTAPGLTQHEEQTIPASVDYEMHLPGAVKVW